MSDVKIVNVSADPEAGKEGREGFEGWWEERSLPQKILLGILFALGGIALLALFGLFVMLLWNWLMPALFGLPKLDYWKAWGLLILCKILFGSMSVGNSSSASVERKRKRQLRRYIREGGDTAGETAASSREV